MMAYFRNNTINLLNLHYGIHSFALSGGGAFFEVGRSRLGHRRVRLRIDQRGIVGGRRTVRLMHPALALRRRGVVPHAEALLSGTGAGGRLGRRCGVMLFPMTERFMDDISLRAATGDHESFPCTNA